MSRLNEIEKMTACDRCAPVTTGGAKLCQSGATFVCNAKPLKPLIEVDPLLGYCFRIAKAAAAYLETLPHTEDHGYNVSTMVPGPDLLRQQPEREAALRAAFGEKP